MTEVESLENLLFIFHYLHIYYLLIFYKRVYSEFLYAFGHL